MHQNQYTYEQYSCIDCLYYVGIVDLLWRNAQFYCSWTVMMPKYRPPFSAKVGFVRIRKPHGELWPSLKFLLKALTHVYTIQCLLFSQRTRHEFCDSRRISCQNALACFKRDFILINKFAVSDASFSWISSLIRATLSSVWLVDRKFWALTYFGSCHFCLDLDNNKTAWFLVIVLLSEKKSGHLLGYWGRFP
jgi:hypothetical protein